MTVKDLIRQLTEFDMEKEVRIAVNYAHEDTLGRVVKGYCFPIEGIETFAGGVDILFPTDSVDHMIEIKNLYKALKENEE